MAISIDTFCTPHYNTPTYELSALPMSTAIDEEHAYASHSNGASKPCRPAHIS